MNDFVNCILATGAQFVMLACMPILVEQVAGEMTWNLLLTLLSFFFVVGYLGKDIRLLLFQIVILVLIVNENMTLMKLFVTGRK